LNNMINGWLLLLRMMRMTVCNAADRGDISAFVR